MSRVIGEPTRDAGLVQLRHFVAKAGPAYAKTRNFDFGPERRDNVSRLSPYIRHRLVREYEVLEHVLAHHSPSAAQKFIQEVFWRGYFKGWLEHRPSVWIDYRTSVAALIRNLDTDSELVERYLTAVEGNTGIDCFDAWARELVETGYLHNHARMWFASIWVFTLKLPWQLGADFLYRHLIDGDAASNTLGWRWVCGLHTPGKTYLARVSNIRNYTDRRFSPHGQLATSAPPLKDSRAHRPRRQLPPSQTLAAGDRYALLITEEDCHPESLIEKYGKPVAILGAPAPRQRSPLPVGIKAYDFASGAVADAVDRLSRTSDIVGSVIEHDDWSSVLTEWANRHKVRNIATAYAAVGPVADLIDDARDALSENGIDVLQLRRTYDTAVWPHARRGYFKLKDRIPALLADLGLLASSAQTSAQHPMDRTPTASRAAPG